MAGFLVDSTVHVQWGRGSPRASTWLEANASELLIVSVISIAEVFTGTKPEDEERWRQYFSQFSEAGVDGRTAEIAGSLRYRLARRGRQLQFADSIIAAQALVNDWTVVTANVRDFAPTNASILDVGR